LRGDLIHAYRILKGIDKVDIKHFFELDDGAHMICVVTISK